MSKIVKRSESDSQRSPVKQELNFNPPIQGGEPYRRNLFGLAVLLLAGAFVFLYLNLFYLPNIPVNLFVDQFILLSDAKRMFHGQMIYRDFFQFTLPATQVWYFFLFKVFGVRAWIPDAMLVVLGLGNMALIIAIARKVIPGKAALLPALLFLVIPFRSQFDATHHWYSTLVAMAGIALLMESRTPLRLAGAGVLLGLSSCFTQTRGLPVAIGIALFLIWEARRKGYARREFWRRQLHLWWPFAAVLAAFNAYFIYETGLIKFLWDTIVFGLRYYPAERWNTFRVYMIDVPRFHPWYRLPALAIFLSIHLLIPLIYILFFVRYWTTAKRNPGAPWDRLMLLSITGTFMFLGIVSAPSWLRICAVSPPGLVLFVWFWNSPGRTRWLRLNAAWVLALLLAVGECAEHGMLWHHDLNLPTGRAAIMEPVLFRELQYFQQKTKPGEYFFGDQMFTFLLNLRPPARISTVTTTSYTRPWQVQNVIEGLEKHRVKIALWSTDLDMPQPSYKGTDCLGPLRRYLKRHYHLAKVFPGGLMVLERDTSPSKPMKTL